MGYQEPATPTVTNNSPTKGLLDKIMIPKRAKNYDLRFNWLKCREAQKQFDWIWKPGKINRADYHSKKHPIKVYQEKRPEFVTAPAA